MPSCLVVTKAQGLINIPKTRKSDKIRTYLLQKLSSDPRLVTIQILCALQISTELNLHAVEIRMIMFMSSFSNVLVR